MFTRFKLTTLVLGESSVDESVGRGRNALNALQDSPRSNLKPMPSHASSWRLIALTFPFAAQGLHILGGSSVRRLQFGDGV